MSLDVGELVAYQRVDTSKVKGDMAKGEQIITTSAAKTGEKAGGLLGGTLGKALKSGLAIGAGFVAFKSVENFIHGSVEAAESLNQSMGRGKVVFGAAEKSVEKWASTTDKSIGLSKQQAIEYAAQLGNVTDQLGFTADASAVMAEKTTTLAVQVAAFKKVDPSAVISAISAGYRDNYKALSKLIPGVNKANVETEALRETGKTTAASLTGQEKATALLALAQKNGGQATAFYGGEANKMAREQKTLNAEITNIKASVGEIAIPFLETLAHIAAYDVIPAVKGAGTVIIDLAHAIDSLPTPVKTAGASLLALVLLGPEIRDLAESVGNNLSGAFESARIQALYMRNAFDSAGGGARGLSKAIGVGGSGLRGAASGLLGVIGGPWGAAFIAASGAVGYLISKHQAAKEKVEDLTKAIEADSGALGDNTRASLTNSLEKSGAVKLANDTGTALSDLTGYLLGQADSVARLNALWAKYPDGIDPATNSTTHMSASALALAEVLGVSGGQIAEASKQAKIHAALMGDDATATDGASTSTDGNTDSTDKNTDATKKNVAAVATYIDKLDAYTQRGLGIRAANRAWQQSLDDARAALKANGKTLDIHTQKGRDNAAALDAMVTALQSQADSESKSGTLTKAARDKLVAQRDTLIEVAKKFYGSETAAKAYVDRLIKIPKVVSTKIVVATYDANRALGVLVGQANKLHALLGEVGPAGNNATGTSNWKGGPTWVGESGRELLWLPKGSRIDSNAKSESLMATVGARTGGSSARGGSAGSGGALVNVENLNQTTGTADDIGIALRYHLRAAGL